MIPAKHLAYAYEAGKAAAIRGAGLHDCPVYAMNAQGQPWRDRWKQGWLDQNRALGRPDPNEAPHSAAPKQALRTGRRRAR